MSDALCILVDNLFNIYDIFNDMYVYAVMSKEVLNSINFVPLDGKATCSISRFISVFIKYERLTNLL